MATILCIEDERDLRDDLVEELEEAGNTVLQAENGKQGLEMILEHQPDLVCCDINMPVMNGRELLHELRTKHPEFVEMPFMFLTAYADREHVLEGIRMGVDDYLTKPVDFDLLVAKVDQRLRQVNKIVDKKNQELVALYQRLAGHQQKKQSDASAGAASAPAVDQFPVSLNSIPIVIFGTIDQELRQFIAVLKESFPNITVFTDPAAYFEKLKNLSVHFIFIYGYDGDRYRELQEQLAKDSKKSIAICVSRLENGWLPKGCEFCSTGSTLTLPVTEDDLKRNMVTWIKSKLAKEFGRSEAA
ncbi:MAG: hypothetical protein C0606_16840 [Hyphomicrobiales bacterium]|mgnify:CR=1 FL=1|nr:MAG: hypothetical protein C0606_16840 [Hyphomicrobiales bacterium]